MSGRYVPPHLRNKPTSPTDAQRSPRSARPLSGSANGSSSAAHSHPHSSPQSSPRPSPSPRDAPVGRNTYQRGGGGPPRRGVSLCVFGDSFAGPFKLLSDENVKVQSFKGASAKVGFYGGSYGEGSALTHT
jgi:hypothetical protein